ncbi:hypothetical protein T440DRAFT_552612 [Plenodomus tracheiphilus IPT5]|uniref:Uncharacterized protein n=1 Tax=Plenodomus tracheiphilus IPT5 TaxID=1408161 RepID=A0A6A7BF22_9PLEO|nr:hypothetical protein T440DRAFT_552612 [Plenodomus tracheiphilus IPT5]
MKSVRGFRAERGTCDALAPEVNKARPLWNSFSDVPSLPSTPILASHRTPDTTQSPS